MTKTPVEYQGPIVVDARVSIASGGLHRYVGIDPISQDLDDNRDRLVLHQEGEMIALYRQRFWRAVETFNPRPLWQWQDEQRRTREEREEVSSPSPEELTEIHLAPASREIAVLHARYKAMQQELTALHVGFSELRQHLGPLLTCLRKEEYYTIPDFTKR